MDIDGDAAAIAWAFKDAESFWKLMLFFSLGWFVCYCFICPWIKIWLIGRKKADLQEIRKMPVFISHLVFSLIFVNPYILFHLWIDYVGFFFCWLEFKIPYVFVLIALAASFSLYFVLLPVVFDCLLQKLPLRLKFFHLKPQLPLRKYITAALPLSAFSFFASYGIYWVADNCWF